MTSVCTYYMIRMITLHSGRQYHNICILSNTKKGMSLICSLLQLIKTEMKSKQQKKQTKKSLLKSNEFNKVTYIFIKMLFTSAFTMIKFLLNSLISELSANFGFNAETKNTHCTHFKGYLSFFKHFFMVTTCFQ